MLKNKVNMAEGPRDGTCVQADLPGRRLRNRCVHLSLHTDTSGNHTHGAYLPGDVYSQGHMNEHIKVVLLQSSLMAKKLNCQKLEKI